MRDPLDLRGLSLTELMECDAEIGRQLDAIELTRPNGETGESLHAALWLADRRQIRAEIERRRGRVILSHA